MKNKKLKYKNKKINLMMKYFENFKNFFFNFRNQKVIRNLDLNLFKNLLDFIIVLFQ